MITIIWEKNKKWKQNSSKPHGEYTVDPGEECKSADTPPGHTFICSLMLTGSWKESTKIHGSLAECRQCSKSKWGQSFI